MFIHVCVYKQPVVRFHTADVKENTKRYEVYFFVIKPNRCTNFTNLFCRETLHVSGRSSAHHQEFIHCKLSNGIWHIGL
jgi:hypothetical protein